MKLGHLSIAIVFIIAFIVASIITAFSLVTFSSLDKAVESSMISELEFVRAAVKSLVARTVAPATAARDQLLANNFTFATLPLRRNSKVGDWESSLSNWTRGFELFSSTLKSIIDVAAYCYECGVSPYEHNYVLWSDFGAATANISAKSIDMFIPTQEGNWTYLSGNYPPWNLTTTFVLPYNCNGAPWQVNAASLTSADWNTGSWSAGSIFYDAVQLKHFMLITFSLPMIFNASSGYCINSLNIDVNTDLIGQQLVELAGRKSRMFLIDVRKTPFYEGALIASSLPSSELVPFDTAALSTNFPSKTTNPEVNALMNRVFDAYGGFAQLRASQTDIIIPDYKDQLVAVAHINTLGKLHWVAISVIPRKYYYGSTSDTIAGTIGGGIFLLIVASVIITFIMFEQQKLVDGSRQTAAIAQKVANDLVLYNTEGAADVLVKAQQPTLVDDETQKEEVNYASHELIQALKQITENLTVYKPHLPEYVLPRSLLAQSEAHKQQQEQSAAMEEDSDREDESLSTKNGHESSHNSSHRRSTSHRSGEGHDSAKLDPNNPYYVQIPEVGGRGKSAKKAAGGSKPDGAAAVSGISQNSHDSSQHSALSAAALQAGVPIAKLALVRNTGDVVERVILANLNLGRINDVIFSQVKSIPKATNVRNVNRIIEIILETGFANDATVHSLIGDNITTTWNATSRVVHADVKAMRFVTSVDSTLKKELREWQVAGTAGPGVGHTVASNPHNVTNPRTGSQDDRKNSNTNVNKITIPVLEDVGLATATLAPMIDPLRSIVSGGVVNGTAWCQLGGSTKRQQFTVINFSEAPLLNSVTELGMQRQFVAVCRTINQNTQHEFVFRGAGIHCPPGSEQALFRNCASAAKNAAGQSTDDVEVRPNTDAAFNQYGLAPTNSSPNTASPASRKKPTTAGSTAGKALLALPIYELCSRKNLGAADEWLYVVGDGGGEGGAAQKFSVEERKASHQKELQHQQQLATLFNEAVIEIARGNGDKAKIVLDRINDSDGEACFLPAYQNLQEIVSRLAM